MSILSCMLNGVSQSIAVSISPKPAMGSRNSPGPVTSETAVADAQGGTGVYTYAWTQVSGDSMTCSNTSAKAVNFTANVALSGEKSAQWKCTVTDNLGNTGFDTVNVVLLEISFV